MLHWIPYALVRIVLCFIAGILSAIYFGEYLPLPHILSILILLIIAYFLSRWLLKRQFYSYNKVLSIIGFITIFLLGYFNTISSDESLNSNHIIQEQGIVEYYVAMVRHPGEERANTMRYLLEVEQYKVDGAWKPGKGKLYVYVDKQQHFRYGDRLLIKGQPDEISPPKNPGEFDYKRFLRFKNIYHQHFLRQGNFQVVNNKSPNVLLQYAFLGRKLASEALADNISAPRELAIAQALVLGVKDGLDNEIQHAYSATGAMHVLAVSGLHVGIIYGIVMLLFGKLQQRRVGKWLFTGTALLVLWGYAMITGFSPSVLRAVTMFSFMVLAKATGRQTNIYNTLAASAFLLLLFDPFMIMSVGFQLSFLAVFGIVYVQPRLYNLIIPNTVLMDKIWSITTVSMAAQLATFPLGIFYFNQFPTFFFLSNLAVIPGAFLILALGLAVIAVSFIESIAAGLGWLLEWCIYIVNEVVFALEGLPFSQVLNIHISVLETWLIFGVISFFLIFFKYKDLQYAWFALVIAVAFSTFRLINVLQAPDKITFYSISQYTAIDFITNGNSFIYGNAELSNNEGKVGYHITPNHVISNIVNTTWWEDGKMAFIRNCFGMKLAFWGEKRILILDDGIDKSLKLLKPLTVDYVLVCSRFNRNLSWIRENIDFGKIILDGSLSWYEANSLKRKLEELGLPYYSVYHSGAYEIKI